MRLTPETIKEPSELRALSYPELDLFAADVRRFLLESISKTGGHIGANLGTVELTIALHLAFDSPKDTIIFDTGHQGYTHKIITGRAYLFPSLNSPGGISRFLTPQESVHDPIEASHAGTSISMGLGIALAKKLRGDLSHTVVVIGDGSLAEGMAWEGLNHAATQDVRLTIVVHDNGYAISPGCGGLHEALRDSKAGALFEALGFTYRGPIDGHSIGRMQGALESFKDSLHAILHVRTDKGHGWEPASRHPLKAHFLMPFDPVTGELRDKPTMPTYPEVVARVIENEMISNEKIVCITPSTLYATGMQPIFDKFGERCFDPGMEEQHAMTLAAGLAKGGMLPIIAYQSTFAQRAFDQLYHDICYHNLPVILLLYRNGFAGYDSPTHHGLYDIPYLRSMPNLEIFSPKDRQQAEWLVGNLIGTAKCPTAVLMPYGPAYDQDPYARGCGGDVDIYHHGSSRVATEVVRMLRAYGVRSNRCHVMQIKTLRLGWHRKALRAVTIEDGVEDGGFGEAVRCCQEMRESDLMTLSVPTSFVKADSTDNLRSFYRLDPKGIVSAILERWPTLQGRAPLPEFDDL